ncbi:MAG TPA: cysteine--tRNA ligase [Woeseiaceae bacterium]|nr:cysteine--tRNA ligase [Woeseiaceae bacterium]
MTLHLHDTLTARKIAFEPVTPGRVTMYLCGPTVYNYAHIGNARPAVVFDVLARLLRRSFTLVFARNITDVDDKIIAAAKETGEPIGGITDRYSAAYRSDMAALGVSPPDIEPRATEHIAEMIDMIATLLEKGFAYEAERHVLFDVSTYEDYGRLSKRDLREMIAGSRVEVAPYKKASHDFVLWKPSVPEQPGWDSPWGRGRPGWHIECSAMSAKHLGRTIDIHGGGQDLVFPHHENELAQSTCAHDGEVFARYWLHNGFLSFGSSKMSKSLGNVLLVHDLVRTVPGEVLRLALLNAHYRQPLEWSDESIDTARSMLDRLYGAVRGIPVSREERAQAEPPAAVVAALEDDLNTPKALAEVFTLARQLNKTTVEQERRALALAIYAAGDLLGLVATDAEQWFAGSHDGGGPTEDEIANLVEQRNKARADRDFATADAIRDRLAAAGISIEDGASGTRWRRTT